MIVIKCPSCGKTYANVKPALIGQSTRCKACQTKFVIDISETFVPNSSSQDHLGSISKSTRQVEKTIDDEFIEFADAWLGGDQEADSKVIDKVPAIPPRIKEDLYELLTEPKPEKPPSLKPVKPKTQLPKRNDDSRLNKSKSDESRLGRMPQMVSSKGFESQKSFPRPDNFARPPEIGQHDQNRSDFEEDKFQTRPWTRGWGWALAICCLLLAVGIDIVLRLTSQPVPTMIEEPQNSIPPNELLTEKPNSKAVDPPKTDPFVMPKVEKDPNVNKVEPEKKQETVKKDTTKEIFGFNDPEIRKGIQVLMDGYKAGVVTKQMEERIYNQALVETKNGNVRSSVVAGLCEILGAGAIRNVKTGEAKLIKAADEGDTLAMAQLGQLYHQGVHLKANKIEGIKLLIESANKKEALGIYYLGMIYLKDQDKTNDNQIEELLETSAKSGIISAMRLLSKVYLNGRMGEKNPGKAVEWLRSAAEQEDPESQEELGDLLYFGNKGVTKSLTEAKKWLEKAGDNGRSGGYISLGMMAKDLEGIEKAKSYWNQAVAMGDHDGTALIGQTLMKDATDQNRIDTALNILEKSAMNGSLLGHVELARYYAYGKKLRDRQGESQVVGLNPPKAFVICKFAAEKEYVDAMVLLADFYSDGIGTAQNKAIAQQLRTKAARARNGQDDE